MTDNRWDEVKELLGAALEIAEPERTSFLDETCADDPALRREVESLLELEGERGDFMAQPVFSLSGDGAEDPNAGRRIGPYRLETRLGQGGMGVVYQAVREDDFTRRVAVKLLKRGMDTEEIVRRFEVERQILAGLEHPNIARLLDGGSTEDGLPYFVLEYIEGEPIDAFCDRRRLSCTRRQELFLAVCSAVSFAHRNLVIHRDLKPANVLVTEDAVPRLLDFGIAKLLDDRDGTRFATLTAAGFRPLTPNYASPEQVVGGTVTTASDVYALGVLLYELLSGHRPYDASTLGPADMRRVICEEDPARPSTAVGRPREVAGEDGGAAGGAPAELGLLRQGEPGKLRRRLAGDLDAIVLKAMRKEPERRYASVELLAEDISRHLEGRPVSARRGTWRYRTGKFLRRNRWGLAAAAGVLAIVALGASVGVQNRQLAHQRQRVVAERNNVAGLTDFLVGAFRAAGPDEVREELPTVLDILDKGRSQLQEGSDLDVETRATLMDVLGRVYRELDRYEEAEDLLKGALDLRRDALGSHHLLVAESLQNLALLYGDMGRPQEDVERMIRQALEIQRDAYRGDDPNLARGINNLASLLRKKGDLDEAESLFREALAMKRRLYPGDHEDVAHTLNNLGLLLKDRGRLEEAEEMLRESLEMRRHALGDGHRDTATAANSLAVVLFEEGDFAAAEPFYRESLAIRRRVHGPYGGKHGDVAVSLNNLGFFLLQQERYAEARESLSEAVTIQLEAEPESKNLPTFRSNLASALLALGDFEGCESQSLQALKELGEPPPRHRWRVAAAKNGLGACLTGLRRFGEAEPLLLESYDQLREAKGEDSSYAETARRRLADFYRTSGRPEMAARYETGPS